MTDPSASMNELRPDDDELPTAAAKGWFAGEIGLLRDMGDEEEEEEEEGVGLDVDDEGDEEGW